MHPLNYIYSSFRIIKNKGLKYFLHQFPNDLIKKMFPDIWFHYKYSHWIEQNEPRIPDFEIWRRDASEFRIKPIISIITPVWNVKETLLRRMIESVILQIYDNWELCIAEGHSENDQIRKVLEEYSKKDARIRIKYLTNNFGIWGNSNEALSISRGDYIVLLDHDDELAPFALYEIVKKINENFHVDFIYSDKDKIDENGKRKTPFFKPDWSPDLFLSINYLCHLTAIRKEIIDGIGGFRKGYEGAQDYDLFLRITEGIKAENIVHIPKILYHWRAHPGSTAGSLVAKPYAIEAGKRAISDALIRREINGEVLDGIFYGSYRVKYHISGNPKISIIIPSRDHMPVLKKCIESIRKKTIYKNYEIIIIDNQSVEPETNSYYEKIKKDPKIRIFNYDKPFNYSLINNYGTSLVQSEIIVFLNNDVEVIAEYWLTAMLEHAQREEVGVVGAKLVYPNNTIQHAGVILGIKGRAGHSQRGCSANQSGYFGRINLIGNYSAVTGACMMMRKNVFAEVGGFDEMFAVSLNDIDLCLKIREKGYLIVYTPYAELYHHESVSRGYEDTPEKKARFAKELEYFRERWQSVIEKGDPYYNPNLTLEEEDFSIRNRIRYPSNH